MLAKVLVIKLRHHGDVLLSTALYRALVEHFPGIQVDVLIYKETTPLLENNPHVHRVLTIDRKLKGWKRVKAELGLLLGVRREKYDAVIHLTDQWVGALITRFSQAPKRVEMFYAKRDKPFWHNSFTDCVMPPARGKAHAVELNLMCLSKLGVDPSSIKGKMALVPSEANQLKVREWLGKEGIGGLNGGDFVLIHPAARWPFKCWEDDKFAEVVAYLLGKGYHVVLTCAPDPVEKAMTAEIERLARQKATGNAVLLNLGGQVSLPLVAAMLSNCRFYIGVDSAPMHMAAALDVPQIALFGPSWVEEWKPWSNRAKVIYAGDFGPLPHPDSINTDDHTRLLRAIPTQVVLKEIEMLEQSTVPQSQIS
ncbi:MAG: putative lipopolysaccharide heptosyltransferase III [Limnobacter sp.]|nr:putative lipopolysaccharide heptosyltransferase III [Limnobacter sp.]